MSNASLIIDGLIIIIYFLSIVMVGLYMGRREKSLHDFALGGRNVPWWAVMASIIAAETSAATFLGVPGEGYAKRGLIYAQLVIGLILGRVLVGYIFLKPYYTYKVYTVYDYLAVRFGEKSKNYVSALFLIMRTLASGTRLFVPSLVMVLAWILLTKGQSIDFSQQVKGLTTTPYAVCIIILTLLTCLYTAVGGIKAVIWTDVIQASIMFFSALAAIGTLLYHIGGDSLNLMDGLRVLGESVPEMKTHRGYIILGWEQEIVKAYMAGRGITEMNAWEWVRLIFANEFTLFSATIGTIMGNMAAFGTDQDMVQRLLTAETYKKSRRSLITAALMDLPIAAGFAFIGVLLIVYFQQNPQYKPVSSADVFGSYILNVMPIGIRGLVLAGVFATAMGSLSAALNALATSATNDWYIPYTTRRRARSEAHHVAVARFFTAVFAVLMIIVAVAFAWVKVERPEVRIIPVVIGVAGLFLGPMLGVFLIGMLTKRRGSDTGNVIAITISLIAMVFLSGQHIDFANLFFVREGDGYVYVLPAWMPVITWTWFAMFGALIVVAVGLLFRTPESMLEHARRKALEAEHGPDTPMAMRGQASAEATGAGPEPKA